MERRSLTLAALALAISATGSSAPALALDQNDTMSAWAGGSDADHAHVLDQLAAENGTLKGADRSRVLDCMNAAAAIAGHGDLRIGDVAEACAAPPGDSDKPQTDI